MPIGFRGNAYSKTITQASDDCQRLETSEKKLTNVVIYVQSAPQKFGTVTTYSLYPVYYASGERFTLYDIDISTLYFANLNTGANGIVSALGVEAE